MPSVAPLITVSNTPGKRPNSGCSVHSQRQCCMADPRFQSYIAAYSSKSCSDTTATTTAMATQRTTVSDIGDNQASAKDSKSILVHQRSASFSSSLVNHTGGNRNQKPYGDLSPNRSPSTTSSSTLVSAKARRRTSAPPTNRSRRSSMTIISDPPVPVPSLPPVFRNSNLSLVSSSTNPSPLSTPTKNQTFQAQSPMDFLVDENAARRSTSTVNTPEIIAMTTSTPTLTQTPLNPNQIPITNHRTLNHSGGTIKRNSSSVTTIVVPTSNSHTTGASTNTSFDRVNDSSFFPSPSPSLSHSQSPSPPPFKPQSQGHGHLRIEDSVIDGRITKSKFLESSTARSSETIKNGGNNHNRLFESEPSFSSFSDNAGRVIKTSIVKSNPGPSTLKATISPPIQSTMTLTGTSTIATTTTTTNTVVDQTPSQVKVDKVKFASPTTAITSLPNTTTVNNTNTTTATSLTASIPNTNTTSSPSNPTSTTSIATSTTSTYSSQTIVVPITDSLKKPLPAPTNHVHLSRKTYSTRPSLFNRLFSSSPSKDKNRLGGNGSGKGKGIGPKRMGTSGSSNGVGGICDIKGTFVIDPTLIVPRGLFRSSFSSPDDISNCDSGNKNRERERERERDVECSTQTGDDCGNGGVLGRISYSGTPSGGGGGGGGGGGRGESPMPKRELQQLTCPKKKNLRLEVENGGIDVDVYLVPSKSKALVTKTRIEATTLELALLPQLLKNKVNKQSIVARINAPIPRPPFQLSARTHTPINTPCLPTKTGTALTPQSVLKSNQNLPKSKSEKEKEKDKVRFNLNHSSLSSTLPSTSPSPSISPPPQSKVPIELDNGTIEIHLPRSFHGPITIHVASGNLDDHISLSKEVEEKCVVLREDEFTRGVFLGSTFDVNNLVESPKETFTSDSLGPEQGGGGGGRKDGGFGGVGGDLDERDNDRRIEEGNENTSLRVDGSQCMRCFRMVNINKDNMNLNSTQTSITEYEGQIPTIQQNTNASLTRTGTLNGSGRYVFPSTHSNETRPQSQPRPRPVSLSLNSTSTSSPHTLIPNSTSFSPTGTPTPTGPGTMTTATLKIPCPLTPTKNKIKRKPVKFIDSCIDSPLSSSNSGTDSSDIQHHDQENGDGNENLVTGIRKNFLDMDVDVDIGSDTPTPRQGQVLSNLKSQRIGIGGKGQSQLGWKLTQTQGLNGRLRVLSEHQPTTIGSSPNTPRVSSPIPTPIQTIPIPTSKQMSIKSMRNEEEDEGNLRVRRISIEKKRFVPDGVGWRDVPIEDIIVTTNQNGGSNNSDSTVGECCCQVPDIRNPSYTHTYTHTHPHSHLYNVTSTVVEEQRNSGSMVGRKQEQENENPESELKVEREKEKEWEGDRVDVTIGNGRVWIQYEDSEENGTVVKEGWFGFWSRIKG